MNYKVAKTIGLNTDIEAAQAVFSILDSDNGFLSLIDLGCDDAFARGRQLLTDLQDEYIGEEGTPAEKLNKIFEKAKISLKDCEKFSILLAAVSGKVLYLIGQGEVGAFLKRGSTISSLLSDSDGQIISGFLEPKDRVLLTTKGLASFLGDDLKKSLDLSLADWEEEITSRITSPEVQGEDQAKGNRAGLLLEVLEEEKEEIAETEGVEEKDLEKQEPKIEIPQQLDKDTVQDRKVYLPKIFSDFKKFIPSGKKGRLMIAAAIILVLTFGIGFKFKTSQDQERQAQIKELLAQAKEDLNTASGLQTLNPQEATNKLNSAKEKIEKASALDSGSADAKNLRNQLESQETNISQAQNSQFDVFLDLELIRSGFKSKNLSFAASNIAILDPEDKTLVQVNVSKKSHQILGGEEQLGEASYFSLYDGTVFVYSEDKGVLKVDSGSQKVTTVASLDKDWGKITDIYGFGGNVYLLDTGANKIWKYLPTSSGYSDKREYLSSETQADLGASVRMQIESSIYILKQNGEMLRFTKGETDHFSYSGLDKGIKDPKSFFVSSDTENLYILDSGNVRLLVLSKTGEFKEQYKGDKFGEASDLVVDEENKKIYLLEDSKIFTTDFK